MTTITALVSRPTGARFSLETLELAEPHPDELLVKLSATGLCHTDLNVLQGRMPMKWPAVLGHEGAGVVEKVGAHVDDFQPGDHVMGHSAWCGRCDACLEGRPKQCVMLMPLNFSGLRDDGSTSMTAADGSAVHGNFLGQSAFATHALIRASGAVKVPDELDLRLVAAFGCSTQTGAGAIINTLRVRAGDSVVVSGTGSVGLAAVMAAAAAGATRIVAVDVLPSRLDEALKVGATHAVDGRDHNVVAQIEHAAGGKADFAFDTTGVPEVVANVAIALKNGGDLGIAASGLEEAALQRMPLLGKTVHNIVAGGAHPRVFLPRLLNLHVHGRFPVDQLLTHYPLADIEAAVEDTKVGKSTKAILTMP